MTESEQRDNGDMRPFPMQDGPPIPWFIAEAIWAQLYRHSQPLEQVAARGGFGWSEVAFMWGPKWGTTREQRAECHRLAREGCR